MRWVRISVAYRVLSRTFHSAADTKAENTFDRIQSTFCVSAMRLVRILKPRGNMFHPMTRVVLPSIFSRADVRQVPSVLVAVQV